MELCLKEKERYFHEKQHFSIKKKNRFSIEIIQFIYLDFERIS